jgi:uncharacterized repeat protein (TIGR01451 family)
LLPASPVLPGLATASAAVPAGFTETTVFSGLTNPTAIRFSPDGRVFVAEKSGLIKVFASLSATTPTVVADLRTNVHNYWDRGLLGMALSPTFPTDPSIYVLYTYDHVLRSDVPAPRWGVVNGTSDGCPNPPGATGDGCVVSGRLSRLQLSGNTQVGPEQVLIEDWCQQYPSHSIGSLAFGADGMLYVSGGDGASFNFVDYGQDGNPLNPCGDPPVAVDELQTPPTAEGGALRSQALRGAPPPSTTDYSQTVLADTPLGYWRLGEASGAVTDTTGGTAGSTTGTVTRDVAGALVSGDDGAIAFDGSSGGVNVPDQNKLDIANGPWTIELWVKLDALKLNTLIGKESGAYQLSVSPEGLIWLVKAGTEVSHYGTNQLQTGGWHHVVWTRAGSSLADNHLYIDGVEDALHGSGSTFTDTSRPLHIGYEGPDGEFTDGSLDEVAMYGRPLTQAEVAEHFQAGRTGTQGSSLPKTLDGAVLRVDPATGAAAAGNPNASSTDANVRRIIAHGLRNPFRITTRPGTNELWVGDVGWNTFEEINRIPAGGDAVIENFGWPCYEGAGRQSGYDSANLTLCESLYSQGAGAVAGPLFTYNHAEKVVLNETCPTGSSSISGLAFYPESGGSFPASYRGGLFFADYSRNCIWFMAKGSNGLPDPATRQTFVAGAAGPVDLVIGPNGDLFYPDFNGGTIRRVSPTATQSPTARIVAVPTSGTAPLSVAFDGSTSTDPGNLALTYAWDLDGDGALDDSTAAAPSWEYTQPGAVTVRLTVTNTSGGTGTTTQVINVTAAPNEPPVPTILTPATGTTWAVGDSIAFSGSATDPEDGDLAASRLSWRLVMHHCPSNCHTHDIQQWPSVASGTFVAPDHSYPSHLELVLTATDSAGSSASTSLQLDPKTVTLTFQSAPTGLQLVVGGVAGTAPFDRTVIQGSSNSVSATSPQVVGGTTYTFASWSDGGSATHNLTAGTSNTTYTATFSGSTPASADVSVTKTGVAGGNGKSVSFTMAVRNNGPSSGAGVTLTDVLPGGTSFTAASTTAGTCAYNSGTKTVSCSIGTLTSGATATVTLDVAVNGKPKSVANTATVSSTATDPNTANNSSTVSVTLK